MARITGGIGVFASGKLGNMVFVQREGMTYIRMAPEYTKNSWTARQKQHRERFRLVNDFCRQHKFSVIKPIWNQIPGKGSGYNRFIKANMPAFGLDGKLADKAMLHFSDGVLPLPYHIKSETVENENNKILISWENDSLISGLYATDEAWYVTAFEEGFGGPYQTGIRRSELKANLDLPAEPSRVEAVYLFFASGDRKRFSADKYLEVQCT